VAIRIVTDDPRKVNQNRDLIASEALVAAYDRFLELRDPESALFPYGFQAINGMVERLRKRAEIARPVTPRTLRDTFAVRRAIDGAGEEELIRELGLADDPRNRESVRRYLSFAAASDPSANN
jgi:integrase/recombinase XerD